MENISIRLVRSIIKLPKDQKDTVKALGLRKMNSIVVKQKNEAILGMVKKVKHLVKIED